MPSPAAGARPFRIPLGTGGLVLMIVPCVILSALAVVQSVLTDGAFDAWKGLSILVVLATGPVTFLVFRGKGRAPGHVAAP